MNKNIKSSVLFALYQVIMLWFFDVFTFVKVGIGLVGMLSISFILILIIQFILKLLFKKNQFLKKYLFLTFIIAAFISGSFISLFLNEHLNVILIVVSSFVVPSLLPSLFVFLTQLFKLNKMVKDNDPINISKEKSVEVEGDEDGNENNEIGEVEVDFVLTNENGKVLLDVKTNKIICFEANDNYAVTYYINDKDEVKKSMERISLKKIEDMLKEIGADSFERVHKSYLINTSFVDEVTGKAQAYKLKMLRLTFLVPVSRSFKVSALK